MKQQERLGPIQLFAVCLNVGCFASEEVRPDASREAPEPMHPNSVPSVLRCCCPYVPGSSPGKTPDDRRAVQMGQSLAGRSRSR